MVCLFVCLLVSCFTSQQHASVSQGQICSDNCTCCHTEIEVADQTFHLTQYSHSILTRGQPVLALTLERQASGRVAIGVPIFKFLSHWYDSTPKKSRRKQDSNPGSSALEADTLPLGQRGGGWSGR